MRAMVRTAVLVVGLVGSTAALALAQTHRSHLGPRVSYDLDAEEFGVGLQVGIPIANRLEFYPSFDYYFVSPGDLWAINADVKFRAFRERPEWLYVGAGLNLERDDFGIVDDTEPGLNLFVGIEPLRGRVHPFGEGRAKFGDRSTFALAAGLNITL